MQRGEKVKFSSLSVSLTPFLVEDGSKMEEPCKLQRRRQWEAGYTKDSNIDRMKNKGKGEKRGERKSSLPCLSVFC